MAKIAITKSTVTYSIMSGDDDLAHRRFSRYIRAPVACVKSALVTLVGNDIGLSLNTSAIRID